MVAVGPADESFFDELLCRVQMIGLGSSLLSSEAVSFGPQRGLWFHKEKTCQIALLDLGTREPDHTGCTLTPEHNHWCPQTSKITVSVQNLKWVTLQHYNVRRKLAIVPNISGLPIVLSTHCNTIRMYEVPPTRAQAFKLRNTIKLIQSKKRKTHQDGSQNSCLFYGAQRYRYWTLQHTLRFSAELFHSKESPHSSSKYLQMKPNKIRLHSGVDRVKHILSQTIVLTKQGQIKVSIPRTFPVIEANVRNSDGHGPHYELCNVLVSKFRLLEYKADVPWQFFDVVGFQACFDLGRANTFVGRQQEYAPTSLHQSVQKWLQVQQ